VLVVQDQRNQHEYRRYDVTPGISRTDVYPGAWSSASSPRTLPTSLTIVATDVRADPHLR
jgi:hypothetical protein